jgi:gluconate 2-dehydrogenase gamma chain
MSEFTIRDSSRRGFLGMVTAAMGARPAMSMLETLGLPAFTPVISSATVPAAWRAGAAAPRYLCLNHDEAAFAEALVNVLCPADGLTPDGVTCGLAASIDRMLADEGDSAALHFKAGIASANRICQERFSVRFAQLVAGDANGFLDDIAARRIAAAELPLDSWLNECVNPLLVRAAFSEQIYDRHCNRVFWKVFGQATSASVLSG